MVTVLKIKNILLLVIFLSICLAIVTYRQASISIASKADIIITEFMALNNSIFDPRTIIHRNYETPSDWLELYKPYINDGKTIVTSPHKVYGPETNDLVLQLRKRGIEKVILAGMSANLCTESHMRELMEQGFEVAVVKDATAAAQVAEGDGYAAALVNFRFIANTVVTTNQAVNSIKNNVALK